MSKRETKNAKDKDLSLQPPAPLEKKDDGFCCFFVTSYKWKQLFNARVRVNHLLDVVLRSAIRALSKEITTKLEGVRNQIQKIEQEEQLAAQIAQAQTAQVDSKPSTATNNPNPPANNPPKATKNSKAPPPAHNSNPPSSNSNANQTTTSSSTSLSSNSKDSRPTSSSPTVPEKKLASSATTTAAPTTTATGVADRKPSTSASAGSSLQAGRSRGKGKVEETVVLNPKEALGKEEANLVKALMQVRKVTSIDLLDESGTPINLRLQPDKYASDFLVPFKNYVLADVSTSEDGSVVLAPFNFQF